MFNQAFFEWLKIEDELVVHYKLAAPFDQLSGPRPSAEPEAETLTERLAPGRDRTASPSQMARLSGLPSRA